MVANHSALNVDWAAASAGMTGRCAAGTAGLGSRRSTICFGQNVLPLHAPDEAVAAQLGQDGAA